MVECDGQFLEKAQNAQEAVEMLTSLSNSQHQVHTGVALVFASQGTLAGVLDVCGMGVLLDIPTTHNVFSSNSQ